MVAAVKGCLDKVGGDDALALDVDVAADVAIVSGGHQHGCRLVGDLKIQRCYNKPETFSCVLTF